MKYKYWIKFTYDPEPRKFIFESLVHMLEDLRRHIIQRGPIEWMQLVE